MRSIGPLRLVSLELQWIQVPVHRASGNKLANLGDTALRHVNEVTGLKVPVFAEGVRVQHFLHVNQVGFCYVQRDSAKQDDLGMPGLLRESASDGHRLINS